MSFDIISKGDKAKAYMMAGFDLGGWVKNSLQLIKDSYGLTATSNVRDIYMFFDDSDMSSSTLAHTHGDTYSKGRIKICFNMKDVYKDVILTDGNGRVKSYSAGASADRTLAHELVHGLMGANIKNFGKLDHFVKEGLAELVHGADDGRDLQELNSSNFEQLLTTGSYGNINDGWYSAGYVWFRFLAYQGTYWRYKNYGEKVTPKRVIQDLMGYLKDGYSFDEAVKGATRTGNTAAVITSQIKQNIDKSNFLAGYCGILLNNDDTGAITGYDASIAAWSDTRSGSVKTADSVVPNTGSPSDWGYGLSLLFDTPAQAYSFAKSNNWTTLTRGDFRLHLPVMYCQMQDSSQTGKFQFGAGALSEVITAGTSNATLWGGGSASDTLSGGSYSRTTYMFGSGDGSDVVRGGTWGSSGDLLYLRGGLKSKKFDGSDLQLTLKAGDTLTLKGVGSQAVRFTTNGKTVKKAEFGVSGAEMQFDSDVNYYLPGSGSTLKIGSGAKVWMEGSHAKASFGNNFSVLDGSSSSGSLLIAGKGSVSETLMGGSGSCSLWGGSGKSNDTLVGGSGQNSFYYLKNNGNDVITEADASDKVVLYNAKKSDIGKIRFQDGGMSLSMKAGGTLTINSVDDSTTFVLKGGAAYQQSGGKWHKA